MSLGGSFMRRNAGLAVPTPIYADTNDSPIDLRKKVAIRRQRRFEYGYSDDEDEDNDVSPSVIPRHAHSETGTDFWFSNGRKNSFQQSVSTNPYYLSLRNLHPGLSEQYGIQYALFNSPEGTHVVPVPYSPFHHRSIISDYKHRYNDDHKDLSYTPTRHKIEPDQRQRFDSVHEETKRILKQNLLNRERKEVSPVRVTPKSGSPSPTEHFKKRHLKQSYWAKKEDPPTYQNGQHVVHTPPARETVQQNHNNSSNSHQSSWLRIKKIVSSRLRSHSCSDVKDGQRTKPQNKSYRIHTGYGSDTDIVLRTAKKPTERPPNNIHRKSQSPTMKKVYNQPIESEENSTDSFIKVQKKHTLLKLLSGTNNYQPRKEVIEERKKGIGVLLQHLQQSPVNHNSRRDDGYPWGVYEYYNHLVERSSRLNPSNYIQRTYADHPSLVDEDSANQQRKRPSRALTGKHVKHGTGASPSTLITLRQKIQERQKAKELLILHGQSENYAKIGSARNSLSKKLKLGNFKRVKQDILPTMYQSPKLCP